MKIIGLTGSIAMGKTTTANMFRSTGIPVNDADAVVHDLYRKEAVPALQDHFPDAIAGGIVNRSLLSNAVIGKPENMKILESIVHPLVEMKRAEFLQRAKARACPLVVLDIPLLFEIGGEQLVDVIVVVSASAETQRNRALARPGMTPEKFETIKAKQISDSEKKERAHFVISTQYGIDHAQIRIKALLRALA